MVQLKTTDTTLDQNCQITNNSGKDVIVISATDFSTNAENAKPKFCYQQTLTQLTLTSDKTVLTVLKNGSTATVTLSGTYVNSKGETKQCYGFDLIFAEPNNLAPVKNIFVQPDYSAIPWSYPAITITPDDASQMAAAMAFTQKITAFPNSNTAKSFTAILNENQPLKQMKADVAQFFKNTSDYANVDFDSYMVASTYFSTFLPQWVYGTDVPYLPAQTNPNTPQVYAHTEYSYWLYASTDMGGGSNGASTASCSGRVTFGVGTVSPPAGQSYTNNYPVSLTGDPTDHNCGIKAYVLQEYYQIPTGTGTPLYFHNGQLVDNIDSPTICLKTGFALKSTFTRDITDATLWPILTGTMSGVQVIGVPMRPQDAWDKFCNYWTSMTFNKFVQLFLTIMGVLMALDFIKTKLAGKERAAQEKQANENQGGDLTPDQEAAVEQLGEDTQTNAEAAATETADLMKDPNLQLPTADNVSSTQDQIAGQTDDADNSAANDSVNQTLAADESFLNQTGNLDNDQDVQNVAGDVMQTETDMQSGNKPQVQNDLNTAATDEQNLVEDDGAELSDAALNTEKEAQALDTEVNSMQTDGANENTVETEGNEGQGVDTDATIVDGAT